MMTLLSLADAEGSVKARLLQHYDDLEDIEVKAFMSALVNTIGLAALNSLFAEGQKGSAASGERFEGTGRGFNFAELPRDELVRSLEAASGLRRVACVEALASLEDFVFESLTTNEAVVVEKIGTFRREHGTTFYLELAESQRCTPAGTHANSN